MTSTTNVYRFRGKRPVFNKGTEDRAEYVYKRTMLYLYTVLVIGIVLLAAMRIVDVIYDAKNAEILAEYQQLAVVDATYQTALEIEDVVFEQFAQNMSVQRDVQIYQSTPDVVDIHLTSFDDYEDSLYVTWDMCIGDDVIIVDDSTTLTRLATPDEIYGEMDFSSFQPWMDYRKITNERSKGYAICNSEYTYSGSNGLLRYQLQEGEFSVDDDDYIVAMGTYYKPRGTMGTRYLIVTENGMFTVRTGDEKADIHTDDHNMFTRHKDGSVAAILEWIVDSNHLQDKVASSGNVVNTTDFDEIHGNIMYVYRID